MKLFRTSRSAGYLAVRHFLLWAWPALATGQAVPHQAGKISTEQVALAYEAFGARRDALPLLVVNGGPACPTLTCCPPTSGRSWPGSAK